MTTIKAFKSTDILSFNKINLDYWTETYSISFYQQYLIKWPDLCISLTHPDSSLMGYLFGKIEGRGMDHHGHVTALSISPTHRKIGLASQLMKQFEHLSSILSPTYFIDLRVVGYYGDQEDAYDMRKALPRDVNKETVRQDGHLHRCAPEDTIFEN
ncbi:hypothetical protein E3P99_00983 [Wallemia hederae]|uniref:N-acetyltransferase domain-containing protein n=1 Tax=Wallemia hederae TaxID=1540922 RepID=A0A4T0FSK4_9BASI|nr:hypothetical protein E3P99_00983 [Wallemia hederae]